MEVGILHHLLDAPNVSEPSLFTPWLPRSPAEPNHAPFAFACDVSEVSDRIPAVRTTPLPWPFPL